MPAISTLIKVVSENFTAKVLIALTAYMIIVSFSFTYFFFQYQYRFLTENLVKNGKLLAEILAHEARIGVFSENNTFLRPPGLDHFWNEQCGFFFQDHPDFS